MEDAQHHKPPAIEAILKYVGCAENLKHDLAVLLPACD
jgi:hypothetical protein